MAGLRGNTGWVAMQKQVSAGTLATIALPAGAAGCIKTPLTGGGIAPARTIAQLSETDASRDQGISYVSQESVSGSPAFYGRDASLGQYLQAVLGTDVVTGTTPNWVHTMTPGSTIPYMSMWRNVSDTLFESFLDCKVSGLVIAANAGAPLTCTATVMGRQAARLMTDPTISPAIPLESSQVYTYNDAIVTLGGTATALIGDFSLTLENTVVVQQTDNITPLDVTEGLRRASLSFTMIFASLAEYNSFHYGSTSGTTVSPNLYTTSAEFTFSHGANNSADFLLPNIAYETFPVDVNPAGSPITVAVTAVAQRGGSPIVTAALHNQVAIY